MRGYGLEAAAFKIALREPRFADSSPGFRGMRFESRVTSPESRASPIARQAARLAFAFSTNLENAGLSSTAMSASTLRSIATAAFFNPFMKRL